MTSESTPTIQLRQRWQLGEQFDEGGFGDIYEGTGEDGRPAVINLIPKEPGASRELLFEDLSGVRNVVPIWDSGAWGSFWVVVMPRAEKSLEEHLAESGGRLGTTESVAVLIDIATAMSDFGTRVVHRDISARNVLL